MRYIVTILSSLLFSSMAVPAGHYQPTYSDELMAIAMNESHGGECMNHRRITFGLNKGQKAGGAFGLMPLTVKEILQRDESLSEYKWLLKLKKDQLSRALTNDRTMDFRLAMSHWSRLRKNYGPKRAAYAWLYGPTAARYATVKRVTTNFYVVKFSRTLTKRIVDVVISKTPETAYGNQEPVRISPATTHWAQRGFSQSGEL